MNFNLDDPHLYSLEDMFIQGAGGYGARTTGEPKGEGFFGPLTNSQGNPMTEYSSSDDMMTYPLITPNQSFMDMNRLLQQQQVSKDMQRRAWEHAESRRLTGRNPFADYTEEFRGYSR